MANTTPISLLQRPLALASSYAWDPLVSLARSSVCSLFSRLQVGLLTIHDVDGTVAYYGDASLIAAAEAQKGGASGSSSPGLRLEKEPIKAELDIQKDTFWVRMFFGADLGFSEAYMAGEVLTPDLGDCFSVSICTICAFGAPLRKQHSICSLADVAWYA